MNDRLRSATLRRELPTADVRVYSRVGSTSAAAERLLAQGRLVPPAIVVASLQTSGRGQRTNRWWSDSGSLCATFALSAAESRPPVQVPFRAALAVVAALEGFVPRPCLQLKWPNDVLADGRKLAGILCQRVRGVDLLGMGINVRCDLRRAPSDVALRATTLARLCRRPPSRAELLVRLWHALAAEWPQPEWHVRYSERHALNGLWVCVEDDGATAQGFCEGIDAEGCLRLRNGRRVHRVASGTVVSAAPRAQM